MILDDGGIVGGAKDGVGAGGFEGERGEYPGSAVGEDSDGNESGDEEEEDEKVFHGAREVGRGFAPFDETPAIDGDLKEVDGNAEEGEEGNEGGAEVEDELAIEEIEVVEGEVKVDAAIVAIAVSALASEAAPEFPAEEGPSEANEVAEGEIGDEEGNELIAQVADFALGGAGDGG